MWSHRSWGSLDLLCVFFPGLSVKAPMEMGSNSTEKFYRIPEGKGPHSVGCTDLMTENAVEVKLSVLSPLDLSQNVSETTCCSFTDESNRSMCRDAAWLTLTAELTVLSVPM